MAKTSDDHAQVFLARACEFFSAAEELFTSEKRANAQGTWLHPIYFMYSQAAEHALKTFIRSHKPEVKCIHDLRELYDECADLGLVIGPDDRWRIGNIVNLLDSGNEDSGFRYSIRRGPLPDLAWTREEVGRLIEAVKSHAMCALEEHPLRLGHPTKLLMIWGKPAKNPKP